MSMERDIDRTVRRWRPEVVAFATLMEEQLRRHDGPIPNRASWRDGTVNVGNMADRAYSEAARLLPGMTQTARPVWKIAANIANYALMMADLAGELPIAPLDPWLPLADAPRDGSLLWLLVDYGDQEPTSIEHRQLDSRNSLEDARYAATLGMNTDANTCSDPENGWRLVGWNWSHDFFTEGQGIVLAWKPIGFDLVPPECFTPRFAGEATKDDSSAEPQINAAIQLGDLVRSAIDDINGEFPAEATALDCTIRFDFVGKPYTLTVMHDLQDAGPDDFPTRKHELERAGVDMLVGGLGIMQDGKRIDPADFVLSGSNSDELPRDVRRLVIAAREYTDGGIDLDGTEQGSAGRELLEALEAFSSRVPYADQPAEVPPHFDMIEEGDGVRMVALPSWERNNNSTFLRCLLEATNDVTEEQVAAWTDDQCKEADVWACSVHLSASDNDDVIVPPRPSFIPMVDRYAGRNPITGEPYSPVSEADLSH